MFKNLNCSSCLKVLFKTISSIIKQKNSNACRFLNSYVLKIWNHYDTKLENRLKNHFCTEVWTFQKNGITFKSKLNWNRTTLDQKNSSKRSTLSFSAISVICCTVWDDRGAPGSARKWTIPNISGRDIPPNYKTSNFSKFFKKTKQKIFFLYFGFYYQIKS